MLIIRSQLFKNVRKAMPWTIWKRLVQTRMKKQILRKRLTIADLFEGL